MADFEDEPRHEPDYEVGYGRPPAETRFRRGRSGNPRGRPRGSRDHRALVRKVAVARTSIRKNGNTVRLRNIDLVIDAVRREAARGNATALQLLQRYGGLEPDLEPQIAKGILFTGRKLTQEEWEAKYGHLGEPDAEERRYRKLGGKADGTGPSDESR